MAKENETNKINETAEPIAEDVNELEKIRREKLDKLKRAGNDPYLIETYDVGAHSSEIKADFDSFDGKEVSIAGRIMANRHMGKASFVDIQDKGGKIQIYVKKDNIGDSEYEAFLETDIGDIAGVVGKVFKTRHGEISVNAEKFTLLSKSLKVLPNKWQGLKDPDIRYRKRYLDLIMSEDVRDLFRKRSAIVKEIKRYLEEEEGFLEVDTPILTTIAGGANARTFDTHFNALDLDMKLRISNELPLKRLIVGGLDRVYELGKMFRNEGMDKNHNPEFTSMELYQAYTNLEGMMRLTENLIAEVCKKVNGTTKVVYDGKEIDFKTPWKVISMTDAVKEKTGVDFAVIGSDEEAIKVAKEHGIEDADDLVWGTALPEFFEKYCEDDLVQPTFVTGHPVEISPLAKKDPNDPRLTRRFEAFTNGWEIANAFSELNDPIDQLERFEMQQRNLEAGDEEAHPMDLDFVNALEIAMPPTGGLGIGIDRVIMLLTGAASIRDIILFPTMK